MHTPGPWEAEGQFTVKVGGGHLSTQHTGNFATVAEREANAALIAAAPDLLEACKLALRAFEKNDCIDWAILEAAIKKAEGR